MGVGGCHFYVDESFWEIFSIPFYYPPYTDTALFESST